MNSTTLPQITQTPVITLPGVNVADVAKKYHNGHYERILLSCTGGQQVVNNTNQVTRLIHGGEVGDSGFSYTKRNGVEVTYLTVNQDLYEGLEPAARTRPLNCDWCRWPLQDQYTGNPIKLNVSYDANGKVIYTFICDGRSAYCDEACGLAYFKHTNVGENRFDIMRHQTESLIHSLWMLRHPEGPALEPALDYHLLSSNGGPMSREQYKDGKKTYTRDTTSIIVKYGKSVYQQE